MWVAERAKMMEKRMRKLDGLRRAAPPPVVEGRPDADVTFVAWGSTVGAIRDAMPILEAQGISTNLLFVRTVYPLRADIVSTTLESARTSLLVEANYSGQLGQLIRQETGILLPHRLLKYDGEPFYPHEIVAKVREMTGHGGQ